MKYQRARGSGVVKNNRNNTTNTHTRGIVGTDSQQGVSTKWNRIQTRALQSVGQCDISALLCSFCRSKHALFCQHFVNLRPHQLNLLTTPFTISTGTFALMRSTVQPLPPRGGLVTRRDPSPPRPRESPRWPSPSIRLLSRDSNLRMCTRDPPVGMGGSSSTPDLWLSYVSVGTAGVPRGRRSRGRGEGQGPRTTTTAAAAPPRPWHVHVRGPTVRGRRQEAGEAGAGEAGAGGAGGAKARGGARRLHIGPISDGRRPGAPFSKPCTGCCQLRVHGWRPHGGRQRQRGGASCAPGRSMPRLLACEPCHVAAPVGRREH